MGFLKNPFLIGPLKFKMAEIRRISAVLKIVKSPYLHGKSFNFDKIYTQIWKPITVT